MIPAALLAKVATDIPVDPDAPTAQRWLRKELSRPEYHSDATLLERLGAWFRRSFDGARVTVPDLNAAQAGLMVIGLLVAVGVVAFVVAGPVRTARRAAGDVGSVLAEDDDRTAAQLRAAADAAAAAQDWSTALIERFRAIVRGLEERVVLDPRPGRTADEAAAEAGRRMPDVATGLRSGARRFDEVSYGKQLAGPPDDHAMRELDQAVRRCRPRPPDHGTGNAGTGPDTEYAAAGGDGQAPIPQEAGR